MGGAIGDIGTHGYNLAAFVTGEEPTHLLADLSSMVAGRTVDDDAMILMRYASGARGALLASQVLPGNGNNFSLRIFGDRGGLEWRQETPEDLWFTPLGKPRQILRRNGADASPTAIAASRIPAAHPEGYLEAFANLYRDAADVLSGVRTESLVPGANDGVRGMAFIDACLKSQAAGNSWVEFSQMQAFG